GVGAGGILTGNVRRVAVSPHAGISWRTDGGFLFAVHDVLSILPPIGGNGTGVDNRISLALGYASESFDLSAGPSLSFYYLPLCATSYCGRVVGLSPGAALQVHGYFAGPLGLSLSAAVSWVGGASFLLPGGVSATVIAGPVLRWSTK
ncbi:MAG: hypothetical protein ABI193_18920, partial [Minicystis sp.]